MNLKNKVLKFSFSLPFYLNKEIKIKKRERKVINSSILKIK